jgi:hypothetical protein
MLLPACKIETPPISEKGEITLSVSSSAFQEGEKIPVRYTCEGEDVSPPLNWSQPPAGTQSLVLIVDDPDAPRGVFTHWVLYNVLPETRELPEAVPAQAELPDGALQGKNGFGTPGYRGPCPPPGTQHRYQFKLYALDRLLDLGPGASKQQVVDAMQEHILVQGQLTGTFQR